MNEMKVEWNELISSMKSYIKRTKQQHTWTKYADEAILEHHRVFAKWIKPLPPKRQLSDFYHPLAVQVNGKLLSVTTGIGLANEKPKEIYDQPGHLWTGNKAIKELHKIMSISEKDAKSCLAKQTF